MTSDVTSSNSLTLNPDELDGNELEPVARADEDLEKDSALATLWARYKETGDKDARDQLIVYYSPLVKHVAGRVSGGLPKTIEQADLVSYGTFGLMDAIEKFDPSRNVKFESYAIVRIKGTMIDELRAIDWVPRSVRAKARAVENAISTLEANLLRSPTESEIADQMGITERELHDILSQVSFIGLVALDEVLPGNSDRGSVTTFGDTLADKSGGPMASYEIQEMRQLLQAAVSRLSEREKKVLALYYYEGLTLAEIGQVLGVTESRVCQIHTKAVLQLRSKMSRQERP